MARAMWPVLFLLNSLLPAEAVEPLTIRRPFLWEFQHVDSDVRSCLFGTIHVNDPNITQLHPQVRAAFEASAAAWFEIDFLADQALQTKAISLPPGQRLEDLVPAATVARIEQRIRNLSPLLSRAALPEYRVIIWPLVLANLQAQMSRLGTLPMDAQLLMAARQAGMKTGGLEDAADQLRPLIELPLEDQLEFLEASLDVMDEDDEEGVDPLETLVQLYASGNSHDLQKHLEREFRRPRISAELRQTFIDALLIRRNHNMVRAIQALVEAAPDDVHFVAVGTAHLLGRDSIVEGLQEAGFSVRRVSADDDIPCGRHSDE